MAKSYDLRREVQVAKFQALIDAVKELDGNTDEIEAKLDAIIVLLNSIDTKVATEATLLALEATANAIETLLTSIDGKVATEAKQDAAIVELQAIKGFVDQIETLLTSIDGKDFATETTLAAIKAKTDQLNFTGLKLRTTGEDASGGGGGGSYGDNATVSTVALTAVSASVLAANTDRKQFVVFNATNDFIYLFFGTPAVAGKGITLAKKETYIESVYRGQVTAIMDTGKSGNIEVTDVTL